MRSRTKEQNKQLQVDDKVLERIRSLILEASGPAGLLKEPLERIFIPDKGNKTLAEEITEYAKDTLKKKKLAHYDDVPRICATIYRRKKKS